ncbi:MAG: helix-turn-helix domain-containing protein [Clostridia bacterium]|nr:helix-turn-helix domain-containing protein [Clostridia bacterium]
MNLLQTMKYPVKHPVLTQLINYFWEIKSDQRVGVDHKLLPVCNADLILHFSSAIKYISAGNLESEQKRIHLNGIRSRFQIIRQSGPLDVLGISFLPLGVYPFFKTPLIEFANKNIEVVLFAHEFTSRIEEKLGLAGDTSEKLELLETELLKILNTEEIPSEEVCLIFRYFHMSIDHMDIQEFCERFGVHPRRLERIFAKYIGISPKQFQRLHRFQNVIRQLEVKRFPSLTEVAYENEYYDQNHFIKEFKEFAGCAPSQFIHEKKAVRQILQYS